MEDLLEFRENSAAGRMTTEYVAVAKTATVADAVRALREFDGRYRNDDGNLSDRRERSAAGSGSAGAAGAGEGGDAAGCVWPKRGLFPAQRMRMNSRWRSYSTSTTCARCRCWMTQGKLVGVVEADHVIAFLRRGQMTRWDVLLDMPHAVQAQPSGMMRSGIRSSSAMLGRTKLAKTADTAVPRRAGAGLYYRQCG